MATTEYETIVCSVCGDEHELRWVKALSSRLKQDRICFTCDFWKRRVEWAAEHPDESVVVDGSAFSIRPDLSPETDRWLAGMNGSKNVILFNDGRRVVSRNLWHNGEVPERWRDQLPDNAVFE